MVVLLLESLAGIALPLSILMAIAWVVQQRTSISGGVDPIWTFSVGFCGAGSALWPTAGAAPNARQWLIAPSVHVTGIPPLEAQMLRARGACYRDYQSRTSAFFPLPPQKGVVT